MQDRQNAAIARGVQELVALPTSRQGSGFGFTVTDDACNDQIRNIECSAIRVTQCIAKFAAFMDAARSFWRNVPWNSAGERKLLEQPVHAVQILTDVGVELTVSSLQIGMGDQRRTAVARANYVDHVQIIALDDPIQVNTQHVQARGGSPVSEQAWFD